MIEREPLCPVDYCPAPGDPDAHVCPHCQGNTVDHQHVVSRGMGGSAKRKYDPTNVVMICRLLHEKITLHMMGNGFYVDADGVKHYRVWDVRNETVADYTPYWIQGDNTNGASAAASVGHHSALGKASAEALGAGEESSMGVLAESTSPAPSLLGWLDQGYALSEQSRQSPWAWGDWGINGEQWFGEEWAGHVSRFVDGWYDDEGWHAPVINQHTLISRMYVASRFPPAERVQALTFSHHKAVCGANDQDAAMLLSVAYTNHWPVAVLSQVAREFSGKATPRGVRRFTREEVKVILVRIRDAIKAAW